MFTEKANKQQIKKYLFIETRVEKQDIDESKSAKRAFSRTLKEL